VDFQNARCNNKDIVRRLWFFFVGRDSTAALMIRHGLDRTGMGSHQGQDFPSPFREALEPTQPPAQWAHSLFRGGKAAGWWL
jgi:hypothetical protein